MLSGGKFANRPSQGMHVEDVEQSAAAVETDFLRFAVDGECIRLDDLRLLADLVDEISFHGSRITVSSQKLCMDGSQVEQMTIGGMVRRTTIPITMYELVILTDLGRVRPLKLRPTGDDPAAKSHLVELDHLGKTFNQPPLHEIVTDQAGRFQQGAAVERRGGMSYGEEHELEGHLEHEAIKEVATQIELIVRAEGFPSWLLLAPRPILRRLEAALPRSAADCLAKSVAGDLTNLPLADLESRIFADV
jgi:hypothetical protein